MKLTLSVIKADIGSIGGHEKPSEKVLKTIADHVKENAAGLLLDYKIFWCGDDTAILMTHTKGEDNPEIHKMAYDAFFKATQVAKSQGLYGAGQDLLKDSFSGNVKGMGPGVAEMEFEERPNEPFLFFQADKTDPGCFNLPLYLTFTDPMFNPGLFISPILRKGFTFTIMDVSYTKGDKVITLHTPEDLYSIAALLRDHDKYIIESIKVRETGEICAKVSTSRLHNIAGKYVGKDDPVCLVRVQKTFPDTGEVVSPYGIGHFVAGDNRGSHNTPLMPVKWGTMPNFFDGPAIVSAAGLCMHDGIMTEHVDIFEGPTWDRIREKIADKWVEMRKQGFFGCAMLGLGELEYTEIMDHLEELEKKFVVRK